MEVEDRTSLPDAHLVRLSLPSDTQKRSSFMWEVLSEECVSCFLCLWLIDHLWKDVNSETWTSSFVWDPGQVRHRQPLGFLGAEVAHRSVSM